MTYAVIRTGGKQYRVAEGDVIRVEKLDGEPGDQHTFDEVLLAADDGNVQVGTPMVSGASVGAEILDQLRAKKILVFKKKRRKKYRRHQGHRQYLTSLRVTSINAGAVSAEA